MQFMQIKFGKLIPTWIDDGARVLKIGNGANPRRGQRSR